MKNIVITTPTFGKFDTTPLKLLEARGFSLRNAKTAGYSEQQIVNMIDAHTVAIVTGLEPITETVIKYAKNLEIIVKHGAGIDNIDIAAAEQHGVKVMNTPGVNADAVADLAIGLFFALARKIPMAHNKVLSGEWPKVFGTNVWGKTCGLIGFGNIGKKVAIRAKGLNMHVLAYDPIWDDQFALKYDIKRLSLDEIFSNADFLSIHLPLLPTTVNFIGRSELTKMKKNAFLINTSRGGIIDEEALYYALDNKIIRGAALDVFKEEPVVNSPLLTLENFIATPHCGGYTDGALRATSQAVCDILLRLLS